MAFTWRPPGQSRYRGLTLRGGVMALSGLPRAGTSGLANERALGWWSAGEFRLSQSWLVGGRVDRAENPEGYQRDGVGDVPHPHVVAKRVRTTAARV